MRNSASISGTVASLGLPGVQASFMAEAASLEISSSFTPIMEFLRDAHIQGQLPDRVNRRFFVLLRVHALHVYAHSLRNIFVFHATPCGIS